MEFPTALLGVALGTILLPSLSRASATDDREEYFEFERTGPADNSKEQRRILFRLSVSQYSQIHE